MIDYDACLDELVKIGQQQEDQFTPQELGIKGDRTITREKLKRFARVAVPTALAMGAGWGVGSLAGRKLVGLAQQHAASPLVQKALKLGVPITGAIGAGLTLQKRQLLTDIFKRVQGENSKQPTSKRTTGH